MSPSYKPSVGIWCLGESRPTRFSAASTAKGWASVPDRLTQLKAASEDWQSRHGWPAVNASFHTVHELRSDSSKAVGFNSPNAIALEDYVAGVREGRYPRCTAITAPAFGWPGSELGVILSEDPAIRSIGRALTIEAIGTTRLLLREGIGEGLAIWWPGEDGGVNPLRVAPDEKWSNESIPKSAQWERFREFWVDVLSSALKIEAVVATQSSGLPLICHEKKGGDPAIDIISTGMLARLFRSQVNNQVGAAVMSSNDEVAHDLAVGEFFNQELQANIAAGQFCGFFHANSGHLNPVRHSNLLKIGHHPLDLLVAFDWDCPFGYGSPEVVNDQRLAVATMKGWSARTGKPIYVEYDLVGGVNGPLEALRISMENFARFWEEAVVDETTGAESETFDDEERDESANAREPQLESSATS